MDKKYVFQVYKCEEFYELPTSRVPSPAWLGRGPVLHRMMAISRTCAETKLFRCQWTSCVGRTRRVETTGSLKKLQQTLGSKWKH